jgi:hypothetical protein
MPDRERLLELALKGLEAERAQIDDEIAQIKSQLNHGGRVAPVKTSMTASAPARKRRRMSAEARRKISEAMKRRYAAMRAAAKK